jgi:4-amino-4-deoxy-L-arabinose transferase-like glycosyltransferase
MLLEYTPKLFLFLVSAYYLFKSIKENNISSICLSALILGFATLERPIAFLVPVVVIFFILVFCKLKLKEKLIYSLLFSLIFIATISPWLLHNYTKYGVAKLTTQTGSNLLFYNVAYTEVYKTGKSNRQINEDFKVLAIKQGIDTTSRDSFQNSSIYFNITQQYIKDNFILYCKTHFLGITNMYTSIGIRNIASIFYLELKPINLNQWESPNLFTRIIDFFQNRTKGEIFISLGLSFYLLINYLFTFYAIFLLIRKNEKFVFLFILYFSVITGVPGNARFRAPIMPFVNILCAVGCLYFYDKRINKSPV